MELTFFQRKGEKLVAAGILVLRADVVLPEWVNQDYWVYYTSVPDAIILRGKTGSLTVYKHMLVAVYEVGADQGWPTA